MFIYWETTNPNTTKSYKIVQSLSPKHVAYGVAQSPKPIYSYGKAYLSKHTLWRAATDSGLAHRRDPASSFGPRGCAAHAFFLYPLSFLLREIVFFSHLPHYPFG